VVFLYEGFVKWGSDVGDLLWILLAHEME